LETSEIAAHWLKAQGGPDKDRRPAETYKHSHRSVRVVGPLQGAGEEKHRDKTAPGGMLKSRAHAVGAKIRLIPFRQ
jgi:hypothetical protein